MCGIGKRQSLHRLSTRWRVLGLVAFIMLTVAGTSVVVMADGPNRAGLVVRQDDGTVQTSCIEFSEPDISGLDLLLRSDLRVVVEYGGAHGGAVCKIGGDGCDYPLDDCFCQCVGIDCTYWAYYHLRSDGSWEYSNVGGGSYTVHDGDVEGWSWGPGDYGTSGTQPPVIPFNQICAPPPTSTDTPAPTETHTPEPTSTPTLQPTPTPSETIPPTVTWTARATDTPTLTPTAGPASIEFWADRTQISAGECLSLGWRVSGVTAIYLDNQGVIGEETRQVCPTADTTYTLRVVTESGEEQRQILVRVIPSTLTPTGTAPVAPTATPRVVAAAASATKTPMPTPVPTQASTQPWTPAPAEPAPTDTPLALASAPTATDMPQPTLTFTAIPPTNSPVPATAVAILIVPTNTPQVWGRANSNSASEASRSLIPSPAPREAAGASDIIPESPAQSGYTLLLDYGLFFFLTALLTALAAWVLRRHAV